MAPFTRDRTVPAHDDPRTGAEQAPAAPPKSQALVEGPPENDGGVTGATQRSKTASSGGNGGGSGDSKPAQRSGDRPVPQKAPTPTKGSDGGKGGEKPGGLRLG